MRIVILCVYVAVCSLWKVGDCPPSHCPLARFPSSIRQYLTLPDTHPAFDE